MLPPFQRRLYHSLPPHPSHFVGHLPLQGKAVQILRYLPPYYTIDVEGTPPVQQSCRRPFRSTGGTPDPGTSHMVYVYNIKALGPVYHERRLTGFCTNIPTAFSRNDLFFIISKESGKGKGRTARKNLSNISPVGNCNFPPIEI